MIKAVTLAAALLTATSTLAAEKPVYGVLMNTLSNPFWGAMEQGVREGAAESGVEYFLQAVGSDQEAERQLNVCNFMLQKKLTALIAAAIEAKILAPCLKRANALKIPVADLDGNLDSGVDIAFHIGSDNEEAGAKGAEYLGGLLGKDAKGSVLVIQGPPGDIAGQKRASGFVNELKKAAPGLDIAAQQPGQGAADIAKAMLTHKPEVVAIFCAHDDIALEMVEAARAAGKDKLIVVGADGSADAVKSILAGRLNASVAFLPFLIGKQSVETMKKALTGVKPGGWTYVPTLTLTKDILEAKKDPLLAYLR